MRADLQESGFPRTTAIRQAGTGFPVAVFVVALILRLLPVLLAPGLGIGLDDMFQYDMLGRSLASGNGYRWYAAPDLARMAPLLHVDPGQLEIDPRGLLTTFRAPLYPAFVGLIYLVFGAGATRFLAVRVTQAFLGAALAPLTYFAAGLALDANGGAPQQAGRVARCAGWIVALYPVLLIYPLALATENLFFLLLLGSLVVLLYLAQVAVRATPGGVLPKSAGWVAALAGLLLGLSALTRSVILLFALVALLWIAFGLRRRGLAIIAALTLILTILPWMIRNSIVARKPTAIESSLGYNLYVGYSPTSTGTFAYGPSLDLLSILNDGTRDQVGTQRALAFVAQDPWRVPSLILSRLGYFFDFDLRGFVYFYTNGVLGSISSPLLVAILALLILPFGILSVSAALGLNAVPAGPRGSLLLLLFGSYLLPHILILSEERFHLAMLPIMSIWAASLWTGGWPPRKWHLLSLGVSAILVLLLFLNWGFELAHDGHTLMMLLGPNGSQLYLPY